MITAPIFDDDHDALERLELRISELEAEHAETRRIHIESRRGDLGAAIAILRRYPTYQTPELGAPMGVLRTLAASIRTTHKRVAVIRHRIALQENARRAGGMLLKRTEHYVVLTFAPQPSQWIATALVEAGFVLSEGSWHGQFASVPAQILTAYTTTPQSLTLSQASA